MTIEEDVLRFFFKEKKTIHLLLAPCGPHAHNKSKTNTSTTESFEAIFRQVGKQDFLLGSSLPALFNYFDIFHLFDAESFIRVMPASYNYPIRVSTWAILCAMMRYSKLMFFETFVTRVYAIYKRFF